MMAPRRRQHGVTLIEALVGLVVISIGLLGIAKMQALAIVSTRISSMRSLIAIEASSLASAMHANRVYWSGVATATGSFDLLLTSGTNGAVITSTSDAALSGTPSDCSAMNCVGAPMALYDLSLWGASLYNVMPTSSASVACSGANAVCTITVNWTETYVGMSSATQYAYANGSVQQSYSMVVQP